MPHNLYRCLIIYIKEKLHFDYIIEFGLISKVNFLKLLGEKKIKNRQLYESKGVVNLTELGENLVNDVLTTLHLRNPR